MSPAAKPQIAVVRHGATAWSETGQHTGRSDLPLNEHGRREAEAAAPLLEGRQFALVLVSPLERARETCRLTGFLDQAEVDHDLIEWDYGDMEGRTTAEIRADIPGWSVWTSPIPNGETLEAVGVRADRVIARALDADGDGDVALFAHGHILRILMARWCQLDPIEGRRFPLETATLTMLGWEHEYPTLRLLNHTA